MNRLRITLVSSALGISAGIFYLLCIAFQPFFPNWAMYTSTLWAAAFPGFRWTLSGVAIGLVETMLYGFLAGAIFAIMYNFLMELFSQKLTPKSR